MNWVTDPNSILFFGPLCLFVAICAIELVYCIGRASLNNEKRKSKEVGK